MESDLGSSTVKDNKEEVDFTLELESQNSRTELNPATTPKQYYFGIRYWHPQWLQIFANAKFFTFILCIAGLVEGALVSGFSSIILSSVERRYRFSSTAVSVLLVSFDISVLICVIFISHFGDKGNKPRWIGIGLIIQGIGAFIFSFPKYFFGTYPTGLMGAPTLESCEILEDFNISSCDPSNYLAYFIMLIGNVFIGIGAAPLFTLGISYIDDITFPRFVPIHIGVFYVCVAVGPAIGYGLGGSFLTIYVDPEVDTLLTESNPAWVGAWWLCFLFSSFFSFLSALPFFFYPRVLSNYQDVVEARRKEHPTRYTSKYGDESTFKEQLKAFPIHMLELGKSVSFVCVTLALSFLFLTLYGLVSFGPKFIESVFSIPASTASLLAGAVAIPAGGLGTIAGAVMTYCLKADTKKVSIIPWVASIVAIPLLLGFFITCPSLPLAGINVDYSNSSYGIESDITVASCNFDCKCNSTVYEPVCGADGITYFSPCRAGCQKSFINDDKRMPVFGNCTCVADNLANMQNDPSLFSFFLMDNATATDGRCPQNCNKLGLWLLIIGVVIFLIFLLRVPTLLITIRSVPEEQRTLSLGVQSVLWRALGAIPGPIIFGAIFDSSCTYWQFECGRRGNCWVYNNSSIGLRAFFVSTTGVVINTVLMFFCWVFFPPVTCAARSKTTDEEKKAVEVDGNGVVKVNPVFNPENRETLEVHAT